MFYFRALILLGVGLISSAVWAQNAPFFDYQRTLGCKPNMQKYDKPDQESMCPMPKPGRHDPDFVETTKYRECINQYSTLSLAIYKYNEFVDKCQREAKTKVSPPAPSPVVPKAPQGGTVESDRTYSPGFDCKKATTSTENLICGSEKLSSQDREMNFAYEQLKGRVSAEEMERISRDQKEFLRKRGACRNAACISTLYKSRLDSVFDETAAASDNQFFNDFLKKAAQEEAEKKARDLRQAAEKEKTRLEEKSSTPSCRIHRYWREAIVNYGLSSGEAKYNCSVLLRDLQSKGLSPCSCD